MKLFRKEIEIPESTNVELENGEIIAKGAFGEVRRTLSYPLIEIIKKENKLVLSSKKQTKTVKMFMNTYKAHIQNMIKGVNEPFTYKLKICSGHFPMAVAMENRRIVIKNFLGEKIPRKTQTIPQEVNVKIEGDIITITSPNKESAGRIASDIEQAVRITGKDRRRFQDGIFIIEKAGKKLR